MVFNFSTFRTREVIVHMVKNPYFETQKSLFRISANFTALNYSKLAFKKLVATYRFLPSGNYVRGDLCHDKNNYETKC